MTASLHPKYRADIDGMRAIAIMMVILFHAFPAILPGGFVGVDIFFVISGYLISTIIFTNLQQNSFSFAEFYARRVKRIFPALLLVVATSLIFGWFVLFPQEWVELGKHSFNSLLFIANFALIKRAGYFDASMVKNPMLHFWSLCIEEQFYLLWPLFAAFIFKRNRKILTLVIACCGLSFLANILLVYIKPVADFYLPVTRFWELLSGGLLAHITLRHHSIAHYLGNRFDYSIELIGNIFATFGMLMIAAGALWSQANMFPGFWALLPVTGAFLLIDAGRDSWINRFILGNKFMTGIGLISYPLYLWHWPILSFARIISQAPLSDNQLGALMALAVLLATLTYFLLEKPLRRTQKIRNKTQVLLIGGIILLLVSSLAYFQIVAPRLALGSRAKIFTASSDWHYPGDFNFNEAGNFHFLVSNPAGNNSTLVIGDSHAEQYWPRLQHKVLNNPIHSPVLLFATYGGCPPLIGQDRIQEAQYCDNFYHFAMDFAENNAVSTVVFAAYWELYFGLIYTGEAQHTFTGENRRKLEIAMAQFEKDITTLQQQGKKVFIVLSNPAAFNFDPKLMVNRLSGKIRQTPLDKKDWLDFIAPVRMALQDVAAKTHATIIDPAETLCPENTCPVAGDDHLPLYKDPDHLSQSTILGKAGFIDQVLLP